MQDLKQIQESLKKTRSRDLLLELARRLEFPDARLEITIQGGQPVPVLTVTLPLDAIDAIP